MKKENTARKTTLAFVIPVLIILAWYLATTYNDIPTGILPTIPMVGQAFVDMIHSKELQTDLLISLLRVLKGFIGSAVFGVFLGSLVGKLFKGTVRKEDRSLMNVPFVTGDKDMDAKFVKEATEAGFVNLKGHRTVGGMRASIYNAMPKEGVEKLVEFMKKFEKENA